VSDEELKKFSTWISGEKLTKEETKALMKELCDPADDDGFMPFKRKSFIFMIILLNKLKS